MPEYMQDVAVYATLYVEAPNKTQALAKIHQRVRDMELVIGAEDIDLGDGVKLSPAMTLRQRSGPISDVDD